MHAQSFAPVSNMAPSFHSVRKPLTHRAGCLVIAILIWAIVSLSCEIDASAVYTCSDWPAGSLNLASIVDCPDNALGSFKEIPDELWQGPKFLIDVSRNDLIGSLNFSSPSNTIRSIVVSENSLTGALPTSLPSSLKDFDLSGNNFTGSIPSGWSSSTSLRTIKLRNNAFITGTLPSNWSSLNRLELLDLRGTALGGDIPTSWGSLHRLSSFLVDGCNFTGCVPLGIPFPVPSLQLNGLLLEQCTATPTQSPSTAPTNSSPTTSPSSAPTKSPSKAPTRRTFQPTTEVEIVTESPTSPVGANQNEIAVAVGVGIGVSVFVLVGILGSYYMWRKPARGKSRASAKHPPIPPGKPSSSALAAAESPVGDGSAPLPSAPRPGRTFVPGQGWVQDEATGPRKEPAPPPAPKN